MGKPTTPPEADFELSVDNKRQETDSPQEGKDEIVSANAQHGVQAIEATAAAWGKWDLVIAYALYVLFTSFFFIGGPLTISH